jgi:hypothetical protein
MVGGPGNIWSLKNDQLFALLLDYKDCSVAEHKSWADDTASECYAKFLTGDLRDCVNMHFLEVVCFKLGTFPDISRYTALRHLLVCYVLFLF